VGKPTGPTVKEEEEEEEILVETVEAIKDK
jgi:hypothetical protein